jgi:tetratricopeptide (TPR) repeat protein
LISEAFYEAMKKEHFISVKKEQEMTFKQLLQCMPITKVDSLAGMYKVLNLKRTWPFSEAFKQDSLKIETAEEKLAWNLALKKISWSEAIDKLYNYYINNHELSNARKTMETLVLEYPENTAFCEKTAMLCEELKDNEDAIFYFKRAFYLSPSSDKAKYLFVIYLKLDRPADAIPYLDYSISNTMGSNLDLIKKMAEEIVQLQKSHLKDSTNLSILNQIAYRYFRMGNTYGTSKYIDMILKEDSKNKEALLLLDHIKKQ